MSQSQNENDNDKLQSNLEDKLKELMTTCRIIAAKFGCFDEDSLAEGYLTLARILPKYNPNRATFKTFLVAALRNTYIKYLRDKKSTPPVIYMEGNQLACITYYEDNRYYEVNMFANELLTNVDQASKELLHEFFMHQIPIEIIAENMGLSTSSIYKKIQDALEIIRKKAQDELSTTK